MAGLGRSGSCSLLGLLAKLLNSLQLLAQLVRLTAKVDHVSAKVGSLAARANSRSQQRLKEVEPDCNLTLLSLFTAVQLSRGDDGIRRHVNLDASRLTVGILRQAARQNLGRIDRV